MEGFEEEYEEYEEYEYGEYEYSYVMDFYVWFSFVLVQKEVKNIMV